MIERIKSLLAVKNISSSQFASEIGVQRSGISHILSGRNKPSLDFILKILDHYPEISDSWLLRGEGEMFKKNTQSELFNEVVTPSKKLLEEDVNQERNVNKEVIKKELDETDNIQNKETEISNIDPDKQIPKEKADDVNKIIVVYNDNTFDILKSRK